MYASSRRANSPTSNSRFSDRSATESGMRNVKSQRESNRSSNLEEGKSPKKQDGAKSNRESVNPDSGMKKKVKERKRPSALKNEFVNLSDILTRTTESHSKMAEAHRSASVTMRNFPSVQLFTSFLLVSLFLDASAANPFTLYYIRTTGKDNQLIPVVEEEAYRKFELTTDGSKCASKEVHVSEAFIKNEAGLLENLMLICCKDCSSYVSNGRLTLQGLRYLSDIEVTDDEQSLDIPGDSGTCVNLYGYEETHDSDACIFRLNGNGAFAGSLSSYAPFPNEKHQIDCSDGDTCYKQLTEEAYEITCCCVNNNANCTYSQDYQQNVRTFYNRFMEQSSTAEGSISPLQFHHLDAQNRRKVHCAYGNVIENPKGGGIAKNMGESHITGLDTVPLPWTRAMIPEPVSTCGLKLSFYPHDISKSLYRQDMSFKTMSRIERNDTVSFLHCCNDVDGCNHIAKHFGYNELMTISGTRDEFGFHFPWRDTCGYHAASFLFLIEFKEYIGRCDYYYDIGAKKAVRLFGYERMKYSKTVKIKGYDCARKTVLLHSRALQCPEKYRYYDAVDSPVRDYINCQKKYVDGDKPPTEEFMMAIFREALEHQALKFSCLDSHAKYVPLGEIDSITDMKESPIQACYYIVGSFQGQYAMKTGPVDEESGEIFEFYAEHFMSQKLTYGISYSYNSSYGEAVLICVGEQDLCKQKEVIAELMLPVLHVNKMDSDLINRTKCGDELCSDHLGCHSSTGLGELNTKPTKGCISGRRSDDIHLLACSNAEKRWSKNEVLVDIQSTNDERTELHRVLCDGFGFRSTGKKFNETKSSWPLEL
uniref:Peptidase_M16_C domain-containing protein n=2 Tax=Steinernema glaseri TaxID=37863 RepID=A0A1I7Z1Z1_9BILA